MGGVPDISPSDSNGPSPACAKTEDDAFERRFIPAAGWFADWPLISDCSMRCIFLGPCGYSFGYSGVVYCGDRPEKPNQRLSVAARRSQPPQGLIPMAYVARLMTSPRPISSSVMNPGRRTW